MHTKARSRREGRLSPVELFGLSPLGPTLEQAKLVFFGDPSLPKSRFDHTSLDLTTPRLSLRTWAGRRVLGRTLPILNLVNRTPTPPADGWSVRVTQVRDFRGKRLTYDSHNGTDFVVPPGTVVTAAAPARVVGVRQEWNRGGLKLYLDHGRGLFTTSNHLGRVLVDVGDVVRRGEPVALSAYSGADGFLTFPWVAPHVHYNVALGGVLVDPFAAPGETPLWREGNAPLTPAYLGAEEPFTPTSFDEEVVDAMMADLIPEDRRQALAREPDVTLRGFALLVEAITYPTRFRSPEAGRLLYREEQSRAPHLDLPFRRDDYDGTAFIDEAGLGRA